MKRRTITFSAAAAVTALALFVFLFVERGGGNADEQLTAAPSESGADTDVVEETPAFIDAVGRIVDARGAAFTGSSLQDDLEERFGQGQVTGGWDDQGEPAGGINVRYSSQVWCVTFDSTDVVQVAGFTAVEERCLDEGTSVDRSGSTNSEQPTGGLLIPSG